MENVTIIFLIIHRKKDSCMLFTDKGNVMITEQFTSVPAAYIVVCSC
jgi:hypothetical protein